MFSKINSGNKEFRRDQIYLEGRDGRASEAKLGLVGGEINGSRGSGVLGRGSLIHKRHGIHQNQ